eukprot:363193-Chlamydomonas_euryale.AAC.8
MKPGACTHANAASKPGGSAQSRLRGTPAAWRTAIAARRQYVPLRRCSALYSHTAGHGGVMPLRLDASPGPAVEAVL